MNKDFLCKCGHEYKSHDTRKKAIDKACWFCAIVGNWCEEFVGDNLRYLESKFKEI